MIKEENNFVEMKQVKVSDIIKKILLSSAVIFMMTYYSNSQELSEKSPSSIYFELLGNGMVWTGNYEFKMVQNTRMRFGLGYSTFSFGFMNQSSFLSFPVMLNYITGKGNHHFEFGSGITGILLSASGDSDLNFDLSMVAGYRFQKPDKGFLFRAGLSPSLPIVNPSNRQAWLLPGISMGFNL